jgi:hypothetical protein
MRGVLLDPVSGRPEGAPVSVRECERVQRLWTASRFRRSALDQEQERWERRGREMRDLPEGILRHLEMARAEAGPGEKRGSLNTWSETLYSSIVTETALTAAAEAVVYPASTAVGVYGGIPGGYMVQHRTLHLRCAGQVTTAATPGTMLWGLRWGGVAGVVLVRSNGAGATGTAITMAASQTNVFWRAEWYITCRAEGSGTTGSLFATGIMETEAIPTKFSVTFPLTAPAAVGVDTTTFKDLALTHTPSVATASFAGMQYTLESMN